MNSDDDATQKKKRLMALFDGGDISKSIPKLKGLPSWGSIFGDTPGRERGGVGGSRGSSPRKPAAERKIGQRSKATRLKATRSMPSPMSEGNRERPTRLGSKGDDRTGTPRPAIKPGFKSFSRSRSSDFDSPSSAGRAHSSVPSTPSARHVQGWASDAHGDGGTSSGSQRVGAVDEKLKEQRQRRWGMGVGPERAPPSPGSSPDPCRRRALSMNSSVASVGDMGSPVDDGGILGFFFNPRGSGQGDGSGKSHRHELRRVGSGTFLDLGQPPETPLSAGHRRRQDSGASVRRTGRRTLSPSNRHLRRSFSSFSDDAGGEDEVFNGSGIAILESTTIGADVPFEGRARSGRGSVRGEGIPAEVYRTVPAISSVSMDDELETVASVEDIDDLELFRPRRAHTSAARAPSMVKRKGISDTGAGQPSGVPDPVPPPRVVAAPPTAFGAPAVPVAPVAPMVPIAPAAPADLVSTAITGSTMAKPHEVSPSVVPGTGLKGSSAATPAGVGEVKEAPGPEQSKPSNGEGLASMKTLLPAAIDRGESPAVTEDISPDIAKKVPAVTGKKFQAVTEKEPPVVMEKKIPAATEKKPPAVTEKKPPDSMGKKSLDEMDSKVSGVADKRASAAVGGDAAGEGASGGGGVTASAKGLWAASRGTGWGVLGGGGTRSPGKTRRTFMEKVGDILEAAAETAIPTSPSTQRRRRSVVGKTWEDWDAAFLQKFMTDEVRVMEHRGRRQNVVDAGGDKMELIRLARLWRVPFLSQMDYERQRSILRNPAIGYVDDHGRCALRGTPPPPSTDPPATKSGVSSPPRMRRSAASRGAGKRNGESPAEAIAGGARPRIRRATVRRRVLQAGSAYSRSLATLYLVEVEARRTSGVVDAWACYKRFADFIEVWRGLSSIYPHLDNFEFPGRGREFHGSGVLGLGMGEDKCQESLSALLQLLLELEPRPRELVRFLTPHAADKSAPLPAPAVGPDSGTAGLDLEGVVVIERGKGAQSGNLMQKVSGKDDLKGSEVPTSSIATPLPQTPSTVVFTSIVGILQALAAGHVFGLVRTVPLAVGYMWVGVAGVSGTAAVVVFAAAEGYAAFEDDRPRANGLSATGEQLEVAAQGRAADGNRGFNYLSSNWGTGTNSGGRGLSNNRQSAFGFLESGLIGRHWAGRILVLETALGFALGAVSLYREDSSREIEVMIAASLAPFDDAGASIPTMPWIIGKGIVLALTCLVSAGESAALAMSAVCLPPLVAAISIAISPVGDPEPDDIDITYPSECSGGVDLPVSQGHRAGAGQSDVSGVAPVVGKDADVSSRPSRGDPDVVARVTITGTVLRIVVVAGSAASVYGGGWVIVRPLLVFSLRKILRFLALCLARLRRGYPGVKEDDEARSGGDGGASSPVSEGFDGEFPEQCEDTKNIETPQPEAKPGLAGLRPLKEFWRGTGRNFGKWRRRVFSSSSPESSPQSASPDIPAPPMVNGAVSNTANSTADFEEIDVVDSEIVYQRRWWPMYGSGSWVEMGEGSGEVESMEMRVLGWRPGTGNDRSRLAEVVQAVDDAIASVYAETLAPETIDARRLPDPTSLPSQSLRVAVLHPVATEKLRFDSTGSVALACVALGVAWASRRRECSALSGKRPGRLLCLLGGKTVVTGSIVVLASGWKSLVGFGELPPGLLLCNVEAWRALAGTALIILGYGLERLSSKVGLGETKMSAAAAVRWVTFRVLARVRLWSWNVIKLGLYRGHMDSGDSARDFVPSLGERLPRRSRTTLLFGRNAQAANDEGALRGRSSERAASGGSGGQQSASSGVSKLLSDLSASLHGSAHGVTVGSGRIRLSNGSGRVSGGSSALSEDGSVASATESSGLGNSWINLEDKE